MDMARRQELLALCEAHGERFAEIARRRGGIHTTPISEVAPRKPTARVLQMLHLIADGSSNKEIGRSLFLSEETVKSHVRALLGFLAANNRAHAVAIGFREGLLHASPAQQLKRASADEGSYAPETVIEQVCQAVGRGRQMSSRDHRRHASPRVRAALVPRVELCTRAANESCGKRG
jgi:DNA-binding CsgD family transcriptional regulator